MCNLHILLFVNIVGLGCTWYRDKNIPWYHLISIHGDECQAEKLE